MTQHLSQPEWTAIVAHRLLPLALYQPKTLDEVATELWKDEHLRGLERVPAVDAWLTPILTPELFRLIAHCLCQGPKMRTMGAP